MLLERYRYTNIWVDWPFKSTLVRRELVRRELVRREIVRREIVRWEKS